MNVRLLWLVGVITACASVSPRFEQDIATTFAQDDMRRLQTPDVELYYPAAYGEQAKRVAARATECLRSLRALQPTKRDHGRALLFLTSSNVNNAYVGGQQGGEPLHSLNPLSATAEIFHWYGLGTADTGDIACHEMFHFVHFEQVENVWRVVNAIIGPVVPSQVFLERWFTEGVAQYYEGRLKRASGRPHSPLYRGSFDSYVVAHHGLGGGDLSLSMRELAPFSGAYLTGLYFVEWLASTYGEDKLWQLMDVQGRSFFSPLGATLRFKQVYGLSAGALLDVWSAELVASLGNRARPTSQQVLLPDVGQLARLATDPRTGRMAVLSQGIEQVPLLQILAPDGHLEVERKLTQVTFGRDWILAGPNFTSGLSFSPDGRELFVMNDDFIDRGDTRSQLWRIDIATGEVTQVWQALGRSLGGAVSSRDGHLTYTSVELPPSGGAQVVERDLDSGTSTTIFESPASTSIGAPTWSPAHQQLAFSSLDANGWNLVLRQADGTVRHLTTDGAFNYAPHWVDEDHLVFTRTAGRYLQAHRLEVSTGRLERLSDAPWGVIDAAPTPTGVAFVNRDGSHWSIDALLKGSPSEVVELAVSEQPLPDRHEPDPLIIEQDEPYSSLDHVFLPQLRTPAATASLGTNASGKPTVLTSLYASLDGKDRLGRHAWAINGSLTLPTLENSLSAAYTNLAFAPWSITAAAERDGFVDSTYWTGALSVDRSFWTSPVSLGAQTELVQVPGEAISRYVGPFVSASISSAEATPYGGVQRQLALALDAAFYPHAIGSDRDMGDLRLALTFALPLPISKRHSFVVSVTGRALPGAPAGALRIGGTSRGTSLYQSNDRTVPKGPGVFLPGTLVEGLRGFDDFVVRATAAALATARYRYSFIIDRGTVSTLYLFPSFFMRQIDVEAFGSAALTDNTSATWARAAGASVFFRALFGGALPVSLYYQFAYRFDFALPPLHTVGFAFE
jgi:hypothetical protein